MLIYDFDSAFSRAIIISAPKYPNDIRNVKNMSTQSATVSNVNEMMKLVIRKVIITTLNTNNLFMFLYFLVNVNLRFVFCPAT